MADGLRRIVVGDEIVLLSRYAGEIYAFSNVCPHAAADLGEGWVKRGRINCPDHHYSFDLRSGRPVWPPDESCRLRRFTVQLRAGVVAIKLAPPSNP